MQHVPDYVYLILAALVYIGIKRCFASVMRPERLLLFPALMLFNGYDSLPQLLPALDHSAIAAALLTMAAGLYIGWQHAARWALQFSADGKQVRVPGDISLLVNILVSFAFEFGLHAANAMHAGWLHSNVATATALSVWGLLVGMPLGRGINVLVRRGQAQANALSMDPVSTTLR
ncbi:hypothetical protein [Amantichitinum ursilacus]|uniref:DUF1453 domain-containing protein n=1 Tax=Amantichitinum ursilacus TaxID=857265 RepID=A0A0N0GM59_9NEIS|nr:hypothetical protein [Amantichitinum ursilacus]KPC50655.1 hypothetical protein WG78_16415 [Amantichitinum ursilacus]